ncbi:O-antigen ligase family protein [Pseudomonas sp. TCU-HL1]|uniref:O-antigen ligase family protein n=1 Tax=Pseudomonas sp. TCU-HL1 TaxID=1856685 RepID=UPI0008553DA6|nr:O-antigen ligase family protein [Pseudomonas sp. TCU-HL1]AOE83160.1 hypothetical protein THL1_612 [Pseudomonas sp. TCU-HL1]
MITSKSLQLRREQKRNKINSLIFATLIALNLVVPESLYSAILLVTCIIYLTFYKTKIHKGLKAQTLLLCAMVAPGLLLIGQNEVNNALKDVWYVAKAVLCLLCGYLIASRIKNTQELIKTFIWTCFIVCSFYLINYFVAFNDSAMQAAYDSGSIPMFCCIGFGLAICGQGNYRFDTSKPLKYIALAVMGAAFLLSFSRSLQGTFLIFLLSLAGLFDSTKKTAVSLMLLTMASITIYSILPEYNQNDVSFLGKIKNSISEVSFTKSYDEQEITTNWRGFEASQAQKQFESASTFEKLFGRGLGATVDLGFYVHMGEGLTYRHLPILHNAYYQVLTKFGLLGLFFYALFILGPILFGSTTKNKKPESAEAINIRRASIGLAISLAYTSVTITGAFNKSLVDGLLFISGALYALILNSNKKN